MDFTWKEILTAILGSGGTIGGLIAAATLISGRLDARRKRLQESKEHEIHESVEAMKADIELKRLTAEIDGKKELAITENLWKMITTLEGVVRDKNTENANLEKEIKESTLSQKEVHALYTHLRLMEEEIDHVNMMVWDDTKTNAFMKRFSRVKELIIEARNMLP